MRLHPATKSAAGRSRQLSPERLVNMYAEAAPQSSKSPVVVHGCPGLTRFADVTDKRPRGLHRTPRDGALYLVAAQTLYSIASDGTATSLGTIAGSGRVGMADNGTELCIVAGAKGYIYDTVNGLREISDSDFPGATTVTFMDGFFVFNNPGPGQASEQFFISRLRDGTAYDALDFASAESYPDDLKRVFADHSELLLFGETLEIWFNAGASDFPFRRAQGSVIERGLGATWSVAKIDESVMWLDDSGVVRRLEGSTPIRLSTHAIEHDISLGDWANATAWSYEQEGHAFYVLTVPAANLSQTAGTYVYDASTGEWHDRKSYKKDYWRGGFYAKAFGKHIVCDIDRGRLYEMSLDVYQEDGEHLISSMTFPQVYNNGDRFIVDRFELDMEVGVSDRIQTKTVVIDPWVSRASGITENINGIHADGDTAVAAANAGNLIVSKNNGDTWSSPVSGFSLDNIQDVTADSSGWLAVGANGKKATSPDTNVWTLQTETIAITETGKQLDYSVNTPDATKMAVSSDGLHLYFLKLGGIEQYEMATPWDIANASYLQEKSFTSHGSNADRDFFIRPDGLALYVVNDGSLAKKVFQYTFGTAWDISTIALTGEWAYTYGSQPQGLTFSDSGSKMYFADGGKDEFIEFDLSVPWNVTTASFNGGTSAPQWVPWCEGIQFALDGKRLFGALGGDTSLAQYELSVPWDITTATFSKKYQYDIFWANPDSIVFHPGGNLFYTLSISRDTAIELKTDIAFDLANTTSQFNAVACREGLWVVGADDARIATSPDTTTWTYQPNPLTGHVTALCFAGRWIAGTGNGELAYSDDAETWVSAPAALGGNAVNDIAGNAGTYIAACNGNVLARSIGGDSWGVIGSPFAAGIDITSAAWFDGTWVIGTSDGRIAYSPDLAEWEILSAGVGAVRINGLALSNVSGVAVGDTGAASTADVRTVIGSERVPEPMVMLDESSDTRTWGMSQEWKSMGKQGEYSKRVEWRRRGQHSSYTPRISISSPVKRAVFGANITIRPTR